MVSSLVCTLLPVFLFLPLPLLCSVTDGDNYQNNSLFPSNSVSSTLQRSLFINKHILDPSEEINCDYIKWRSKEWSAWLVRRNIQDGVLLGNYHGSMLRGRNISVIMGQPSLVLGSLQESNSTDQNSIAGSRDVHTFFSVKKFTVYHFVRAPDEQTPDDNFVVYQLYKICNTSFTIIKTIFAEDRETVQLIVPAEEGWEIQKEDFVIFVYFTMNEFDKMSYEDIKSVEMGQSRFSFAVDEIAFLNAARNLFDKYPEFFIGSEDEKLKPEPEHSSDGSANNRADKRFDFQETWTRITSSISAVRSEEVVRNLRGLNRLESYVLFELVKTIEQVAGAWSKLRLLSEISRSLSSSSASSPCNVVLGHSINYGLLTFAALIPLPDMFIL